MNTSFRILFQDDHCVAIEKPAGFWVHQAEESERFRVPPGFNCMRLLRNQLNRYVFPVHRLDRATSGVLLFGLTREFASGVGIAFAERQINKTYLCLVRGHWPDDLKRVESEDGAVTHFECVARTEWPFSVGRYSSSRYSLVFARPETGKRHQIRRHCHSSAHPIIGDKIYGDRDHNRFFQNELKWSGLHLKALELTFQHPMTGEKILVRSRYGHQWHQIFDRFGVCALKPRSSIQGEK